LSESQAKRSRQRRLLSLHPQCYFCGGANASTTVDHVPPRACFPDGYSPEDFEFPACKACNEGTVKHDQVFGFYSLLLDFDESKVLQKVYLEKLEKLKKGIANNYPDALPDESTMIPIHRFGPIVTPQPIAVELATQPALKEAVTHIGAKLTHALYYREVTDILSLGHRFTCGLYQPQRSGTEDLHQFLWSLLPNAVVGNRRNIREYGERFRYLCGYKEPEDLFVYAAQFGRGFVLWGIVCGPGVQIPNSGYLTSAVWRYGACGPGACAAVSK
jgi:hypothetical protein